MTSEKKLKKIRVRFVYLCDPNNTVFERIFHSTSLNEVMCTWFSNYSWVEDRCIVSVEEVN